MVDSHREFTFGNYTLRLVFGRGGDAEDHEDGSPPDRDVARVGGRHVTVALGHRSWDDLTDSERWARLHERL